MPVTTTTSYQQDAVEQPQGSNSATFVLFYSKLCPHSVKALSVIKENDLEHLFELTDVVQAPPPSAVTSVPTVYEKITYKLHVGEAVFGLLDELCKSAVSSYEFGSDGKKGIRFTDVDFVKSERCENFSWFN